MKLFLLVVALLGIEVSLAAQNTERSSVFSRIENPDIPQSVEFAGMKIDLDRVDMFERLDRELTSMAYTHGNTLLVIKRANKYFPTIIPILKKNGVPTDIVYLACIESTLNPRAYSGAKAAGIWQFIPSTAKHYGLEVNEYVDERYNLEKATKAACRYMKDALAKYGNWESVAASYNGGMARITRELGAQNQSSAYDLFLADETSRYMFRLLAIKMIMENPAKYGFHLSADQLYQPAKVREVKVSTPIESWPDWAEKQGISYMILRDYNPWIRAKSLPNKTGKTYTVVIPEKSELKRSTQSRSVYNKNWISK
ncbi:MAG: transglycosylase SLT domain-containing protein [Muribaculum sp.]|nr:transglycosylase SLT domain-containing protein [Muribaculaceae bacterium]MCM1081056.1 transglycosylase SLT domain-containing protein [Muribaculum sp.]